ncbi:TIGR00730 family Rossman fold protein [Alphaproteobacteria bacterium]|nr:TIGR00730 family Rossman fold protein [Alphaproteobacteria bacterium]
MTCNRHKINVKGEINLPPIRSICVFCGASSGNDPVYCEDSLLLGKLIAEAGITLVFGGGNAGMMGAVADGALSAGGEVIGIIPGFLKDREHGHPDVKDLRVVDSMHSRKQLMSDLSDAYVVLPGGVGTLDETLEIITWKQLNRHNKPIVLVDIKGYWLKLDALVAATVEHGFAAPPTRTLYSLVPSIEAVMDRLRPQPRSKFDTDAAQL